MKAGKSSTLTPQELQSLFELPCDVEVQPRLTLAEAPLAPMAFPIPEPPEELPAVEAIWGGINKGLTERQRAEQMLNWLTSILPTANFTLRKKLGRSQWEMCLLLGCTNGTYQRWETGRSVPSGAATLLLLSFCPDAESLARFGLDVTKLTNMRRHYSHEG